MPSIPDKAERTIRIPGMWRPTMIARGPHRLNKRSARTSLSWVAPIYRPKRWINGRPQRRLMTAATSRPLEPSRTPWLLFGDDEEQPARLVLEHEHANEMRQGPPSAWFAQPGGNPIGDLVREECSQPGHGLRSSDFSVPASARPSERNPTQAQCRKRARSARRKRAPHPLPPPCVR